MMKPFTRFSTLAAIVSLAIAPSAFAQSAVKIAYVNSAQIMNQAPGRAEAEATYQKEMTAVRAQLEAMQDTLRTLFEAYQKERGGLDSATRAVREQALGTREEGLSRRAQDLQEQMQERQMQLLNPILEQISKVLDELREQNNYSMIFDVASQASVVVSADKNLDITDRVIARLKQLGAPKPIAAPAQTSPAGPVQRPSGLPRQ